MERSNLNIYDTVNETLRLNASYNLNKSVIKLTNEPTTKSGFNHRMRKLMQIAEGIEESEN